MLSLLLFSSPLLLFVLQFFPFGSTTRRLDCSYESLQSRRQINKKPHQENWSDELMEKRLSGENTALQPLKIRPKLFVPLADQIWILLDKCGLFPPLIFPFFFSRKRVQWIVEMWSYVMAAARSNVSSRTGSVFSVQTANNCGPPGPCRDGLNLCRSLNSLKSFLKPKFCCFVQVSAQQSSETATEKLLQNRV